MCLSGLCVRLLAFAALGAAVAAAAHGVGPNDRPDVKGGPPAKAPPPPPESIGKEEKVRDTPITLRTSYDTVELRESINSRNLLYVAPRFRFLLLDPENKAIARPTRDGEAGTVPVQLSLEMVHPRSATSWSPCSASPGAT